MAAWHTAVKELVHCNKDKEETPVRQEKRKWMLRMVKVYSHFSELVYSPCNHRIMGTDEREITEICT